MAAEMRLQGMWRRAEKDPGVGGEEEPGKKTECSWTADKTTLRKRPPAFSTQRLWEEQSRAKAGIGAGGDGAQQVQTKGQRMSGSRRAGRGKGRERVQTIISRSVGQVDGTVGTKGSWRVLGCSKAEGKDAAVRVLPLLRRQEGVKRKGR